MILPLQQAVRAALQDTLTTLYGHAAVPATLVIETPPTRALGDLALPCAFELARTLRKAPRAIAQEIVAALPPIAGVDPRRGRRRRLHQRLPRPRRLPAPPPRPRRRRPSATGPRPRPSSSTRRSTRTRPRTSATCATRSSATPSAACCASSARRSRSRTTSTTPASRSPTSWSGSSASRARASTTCARSPPARSSTTTAGISTPGSPSGTPPTRTRLAIRKATLHAIEQGGNPTAEMGAVIAEAIVRCHLRTMARLHIDYDLLSWEGDILRLQFWATAFDILKRNGTVYLQHGRQAEGLLGDGDRRGRRRHRRRRPTAADAPTTTTSAEAEGGPNQREKVIVRSDGTVTYVGKDIANQFWKFGLLGKDFLYRPLRDATRRRDAVGDDARPAARPTHPAFGGAGTVDQRHRHAPVLPAEAAEAGAGHDGASCAGRAVDPLLVRDGGAVAQDGARTRLPGRRRTASRSSRCRAARVSA